MSELVANPTMEETSKMMKRSRTWLYVLGSLTILLGIAGSFMSVTMTFVSILFMAVILFVSGIAQIVEVFTAEGWKSKVLAGFMSAVYFIGAACIYLYPGASAVWFTLFIAAFLVVAGIFRVGFGIWTRKELEGWGWVVFSGIISVILGILVFAQWPVSGLWVIGLFVSIELIMQGISMIVAGKAVKEVE